MTCTTVRIYNPETLGLKKFIFVQLAVPAVRLPLQIIFCYSFAYWLIPRYLQKKALWKFVVALVLYLFCFYWLSYYVYWIAWVDTSSAPFELLSLTNLTPFQHHYLLFYSHFNYSGTVIACSIVLIIKYYKRWYSKQRESESLNQENAQAELQLLKAQVHPHFLFNTLNNIYALSLDKSPKTGLMVRKLSNIIQYMITEGSYAAVPLNKEIKMLTDYIALEKIRYGERLDLRVNVQINHEDERLIAPLLLIPYVENCFKHGASKLLDKAWIHLSIEAKDDMLQFNVSNNKPINGALNDNRTKIGLLNVKKRLQLLYPGKHKLEIRSAEDSFTVCLNVLLKQPTNTPQKEKQTLTVQSPVYVS
jgi:sensor histidine kinase YesM